MKKLIIILSIILFASCKEEEPTLININGHGSIQVDCDNCIIRSHEIRKESNGFDNVDLEFDTTNLVSYLVSSRYPFSYTFVYNNDTVRNSVSNKSSSTGIYRAYWDNSLR